MGKPALRRAAIPVLCASESKLEVITAAGQGGGMGVTFDESTVSGTVQ